MNKLTDLWIKAIKEEEIEDYPKEVNDLYDYTIQLQQRINNAIEYMEHYIKVEELNEPVKVEFKEVMKMLRGEENDN